MVMLSGSKWSLLKPSLISTYEASGCERSKPATTASTLTATAVAAAELRRHALLVCTVAAVILMGVPSVTAAQQANCEVTRDDEQGLFRMICSAPQAGTLLTIPPPTSASTNVTEIFIENQPLLRELSWNALSQYPKLRSLTVRRCGLKQLTGSVANITALKTLDLRFNELEVIPWEFIVPLKPSQVRFEGNPLVCNCSAVWMQTLLQRNVTAIDEQLKCRDNNGRYIDLRLANLTICKKPKGEVIRLDHGNAKIGGTFSAECSFSGDEPVIYRWSTEELNLSFEIANSSSPVITIFNLTREQNRRTLNCVGTNAVGRGNVSVTIEMELPPKIYNLMQLSGEAIHTCLKFFVTGTDPMLLEWSKDGDVLEVDSRDWDAQLYDVGKDAASGCLVTHGPYWSGVYTLKVTNAFGSDSKTISVPSQVPADSRQAKSFEGGAASISIDVDDDDTDITATDMEHSAENPEDAKTRAIAGAVASLFVLLLVTVIGVTLHSRRKSFKLKQSKDGAWPRKQSARSRRGMMRQESDVSRTPTIYEAEEFSDDSGEMQGLQVVQPAVVSLSENPHYYQHQVKRTGRVRHIAVEQLAFLNELGEGAFGRVYLGSCTHLTTGDEITMVAIKTLKHTSPDSTWGDFQREAEIMADMHHDNIVSFYGACYTPDCMMMVFEYMENGDLNKYLRARGPDASSLLSTGWRPAVEQSILSVQEMLYISQQVASGVAFLASKHFVHRDLATRNCLVGNKLIVKIGDFGMCRDVYSTDYYRVGGTPMLPIRWMPPESILYRHFTVESDIWSFGVVLWEIFTYGRQPWFELSNNEVISCILEGRVLDRPAVCPPEVYKIITGCWERQPSARTPVELVAGQLAVMLHQLCSGCCEGDTMIRNNNLNDATVPASRPEPTVAADFSEPLVVDV